MEPEEGSEFNFTVEKKITLPDGEYFIILAEYNQKYLLPVKFYDEYNIKTGDNIICKIDKINCNGKVFLEPRHPVYKVGDRDVFTLLEKETRETHKTKDKFVVIKAISDKTKHAIVLDEFNKINTSQGSRFLCEIMKIKKGEVILIPISKT